MNNCTHALCVKPGAQLCPGCGGTILVKPDVRPGLRFLHNKWLDGEKSYAELKTGKPEEIAQLMEVTAIRHGAVYFAWLDRNGNRLRPSHFIGLDRFETIVLQYVFPKPDLA